MIEIGETERKVFRVQSLGCPVIYGKLISV